MRLPDRILMGPGPSDVHPAVLEAQARPLAGHLDPAFLGLLDDACERLRQVLRTANPATFPVSGTGSAGMEAVVVNLVEPGETVVVGVNGVFGGRIAEVARRAGAQVVEVAAAWGEPVDPEAFVAACERHEPALAMLVHAETSTGVRQPVEPVADALRDSPVLLGLDVVTSLAGIEVEIDRWGIDAAYAGTQKCLSVPPGLAPVTFSPRAVAKVRERTTPVRSWYLDLGLLLDYVEGTGEGRRVYHHTAPVSAVAGLHAGLGLVLDEGLEARWARHERLGAQLQRGLADLGLQLLAAEGHRLPQLTAVGLPDGVDEAAWRAELLATHGLEVGPGLGDLAGRAWRVGLMGHGCTERNVLLVLDAVARLLDRRS